MSAACLLLTLFLLWRGDWYPFSNFPMYSSLNKATHSLLATDLDDQPIPFLKLGTNAPTLKKYIRTELDLLKKDGAFASMKNIPPESYHLAVENVIHRFMAIPNHPIHQQQGFRIIRKNYSANDGRVEITTQTLAEFSPPSR